MIPVQSNGNGVLVAEKMISNYLLLKHLIMVSSELDCPILLAMKVGITMEERMLMWCGLIQAGICYGNIVLEAPYPMKLDLLCRYLMGGIYLPAGQYRLMVMY